MHRVQLRAGVAALLLTSCGTQTAPQPPEPEPEPNEADAPADAPSPLDELSVPARFEDAQLEPAREALAQLAREAELAGPDFDAAGAWLVEENPTGALVEPHVMDHLALEEEPEPGAVGERARVNPRLFRRVPTATLAEDGTATVRWQTTRASSGASVYYGTELSEDPFAIARLRRRAGEAQRDGDVRTIAFDVQRLIGARYDITRVRRRGHGVLRWRLEALDDEAGTTRVHDDRFGFRCEPLPCEGDDTRFVRLPTVRLGPFVDLVDDTSAVITVETDVETVARLELIDEDGERHHVVSDGGATRHELSIAGLSPDTRYRYVVLVADARGEVAESRSATFRTWPAPDDDTALTFAVLSDSRSGFGTAEEQYAGTNREVLEDLLRRAVEEGARFVVFVGDLIDGYRTHPGSFRYELEAWQKAVEPIHGLVPIYEVMGNHEALIDYWDVGWAIGQSGETSAEAEFAARFVNPTNAPEAAEGAPPYAENVYSFDAGPAHLAVINSNYWWRSHPSREDHPAADRGQREGWVDDPQLDWLRADLDAARDRSREHVYVFTHEPGYPNGGHVHDAMWWEGEVPEVLERRAAVFGAMSERGVDAIFHGDEHNYSRTRVHEGLDRPLWQLISGGAGAPYYAQVTDLPWTDDVAVFDGRQHVIVVDIDADAAEARVLSRMGETIDRFDLTSAE